MSKKKTVTLSVHRAIVDDRCGWNLGELFSSIRESDTSGRTVDRGLWDKIAVKFPSFPQTNEAIAAQFALFEEGAQKSTIRGHQASEYATAAIGAPTESEFLDHEVAVLVSGNHLIACSLGNRQTLLIDAIGKLADQCDLEFPPGCMRFATIPNKLTVEMIRERGVKSIRFDAANLLGSLDVSSNGLLEHLFGQSAKVDDIKRQEMVAELSLHPKRIGRRGNLEVVETPKDEWLGNAAVKVKNEDRLDSYTIVLADGTEWPEGELKLSRKVDVTRDGSTYQMADALHEMLKYLDDLRTGGHLS